MALNLKTLGVRSASAAVFVVVLLSSVYFSFYSFAAFFAFVGLWGLWEFYKLIELKNTQPNRLLGLAIGAFILLIGVTHNLPFYDGYKLTFSGHVDKYKYVILFPLFFVVMLDELFRNKENPFINIGATLLGVLYVPLAFSLFIQLSGTNFNKFISYQAPVNYNSSLILCIIFLIWSNDTFAYLVGSLIGKNKMYERISPGKTWEGTIGGIILTIALAFGLGFVFKSVPMEDLLVIALIVGVIGTMGDLVESMLKRSVGVKDSGNIMPGHGGILDRFDSLIMIAPFVWAYLQFRYL